MPHGQDFAAALNPYKKDNHAGGKAEMLVRVVELIYEKPCLLGGIDG